MRRRFVNSSLTRKDFAQDQVAPALPGLSRMASASSVLAWSSFPWSAMLARACRGRQRG